MPSSTNTPRLFLRLALAAILASPSAACSVTIPVGRLAAVPAESREAPATAVTPVADTPAASERLAQPSAWDQASATDFCRTVGPAVVDDCPSAPSVEYGPLDALGRATGVRACVDKGAMDAGRSREREDMDDLSPSGWGHNEKVEIASPDGEAYHGYLYNRSHLLAKSLGGAERIENLVTGTRMQNVGMNGGEPGGMAWPETVARDWLDAHPDGTLRYAATPLYVGDELVPRSVVVDVLSSDGSVDVECEVFNVAPGYIIDYATGEWTAVPSDAAVTSAAPAAQAADDDIVLVTGSGKRYHVNTSCPGLEKANKARMREMTRSEAASQGYGPCSLCSDGGA